MTIFKALIAGALISICHLQAAETVVLDVKPLKNMVYNTSTTVENSNEVDIKGSKETMAELKASGVQLPIKVEQKQTIVKVFTTSAKNKKGLLPFSGTLVSNITAKSNTKNGEQHVVRNYEVSGAYQGNTVMVDTVKGDGVKPGLEAAMKQALATLLQSAEYPKNPLKVGDTFSQSVPLSLPVQGAKPINLTLTTQYTLQSIEKEKVQFTIRQKYKLLAPKESPLKVTVGGSGKGAMTYNRAYHQVTSLVTDATMTLKAENGPMTSMIKVHAKTSVRTNVRKKK